MPENVPVRVRDCACPDTPHAEEGDVVYLAPGVSLQMGTVATTQIYDFGSRGDTAGLTGALFETFVRYGVRGANFSPFTVQLLLDDFVLGSAVAEAANDLYAETILRPLGMSPSTSSDGGRTAGSTSRRKRSPTASPA